MGATSRPRARVVLLGGASGSGKTLLTRLLGLPRLELDDFYRDGDDAVLQVRFGGGVVDWDDPVTWNADAAVAAITELCHHGSADVPTYDIPSSQRTGTLRLDLGESRVFIAEGIFAAELALPLQRAGLLADAICLRRHRGMTFARRLARDLAEARKPIPVLLRRGMRLSRDEPELLARWQALGCRLVDRDEALASLRHLDARGSVPPARLHATVDFREVILSSVNGIAARLEWADLDAPIAACPGWTVTDLVEHLGGVHRWATTAIVEGHGNGEEPAAPREREPLREWFAEGAAGLLKALGATDACDPCWTFGPPRTAAFWWRRQAHENAMHAWDLSAATGRALPLQADLAADGVAEVVTMMLPRQVRKGRIEAPLHTIDLHASDTGQTWRIDGSAGPPVVATVIGPAAVLDLLLWRRATLADPRLTVTGDAAAAYRVLSTALTP